MFRRLYKKIARSSTCGVRITLRALCHHYFIVFVLAPENSRNTKNSNKTRSQRAAIFSESVQSGFFLFRNYFGSSLSQFVCYFTGDRGIFRALSKYLLKNLARHTDLKIIIETSFAEVLKFLQHCYISRIYIILEITQNYFHNLMQIIFIFKNWLILKCF
ncbi:hypothetical protein PUN28_009326 [Cardiocondyla obscurior]|uniref:Uncharacterized protein n=1 Tax=Cardiocondyla obscurior TaxID=286306 RepID=A0AAW2FTM6_9HYME